MEYIYIYTYIHTSLSIPSISKSIYIDLSTYIHIYEYSWTVGVAAIHGTDSDARKEGKRSWPVPRPSAAEAQGHEAEACTITQ